MVASTDVEPTAAQLANLRLSISEHFGLEELRLLSADLGINYDNLRGETLDTRAQALITYVQRRGELPTLLRTLYRLRPLAKWPTILPATYSPSDPPYVGLRPFREVDAPLYFGRQETVAELIGRLRATSFVALFGTSGSGKSSLLYAGLLPALKERRELSDGTYPPPSAERWECKIITPSADPLERLALTFAPNAADLADTRAALLDTTSISRVVNRLLSHHDRPRLLLIVDQFEELVTLTDDEVSQSAFVAALLAISRSPNASVLISFRADFLERFDRFEGLGEAIAASHLLLPSMTQAQLRQAIEAPAALHGLRVEHGFTENLLHDLSPGRRPAPGALPLLSHVLRMTWERRGQENVLTNAAYEDAGGVFGAVEQTAEQKYLELTTEQRQVLRRLLTMRLSAWQDGVGYVKRRATLDELLPADPAQAKTIEQVIAVMADAHLFTTGRDDLDREMVELAHEAILTEWGSLRGWLDEDRQTATRVQKVIRGATDWNSNGRDKTYLFRGSRLVEALDATQSDILGPVEAEFLAVSVQRQRKERATLGVIIMLLVAAIAGLFIFLTHLSLPWDSLYGEDEVISLAGNGEKLFFGTVNGCVGTLSTPGTGQIVGCAADGSGSDDGPSPAIDRMVIDPLQPQRLYAAVRWDTLYASEDEGRTWRTLSAGIPPGYYRDLDARDGHLALLVIPGTDSSSIDINRREILLSGDAGQSWTPVDAACEVTGGSVARPTMVNAVHIGLTGDLLVGGAGGLYRVRPEGNTCPRWETLLPLNMVSRIVEVAGGLLLVNLQTDGDVQSELYLWRPDSPVEKLATLDDEILYVSGIVSHQSDEPIITMAADGQINVVSGGQVAELDSGMGLANDILLFEDSTRRLQLLLAHEDGLLSYRQPID